MVASVVDLIALATSLGTHVDSVDSKDHVEELAVRLEAVGDRPVDSEDRQVVQSCSLCVVPKSVLTK